MDGMRNAFAGLFRDDSPWVLAKCGASFQPVSLKSILLDKSSDRRRPVSPAYCYYYANHH